MQHVRRTTQSCALHEVSRDRSSKASEGVLTSVLLQQLVSVLDDFVILLQLQHALAVVQLQGDDHPTQINVVYVARHLLHVRAQMEGEGEEEEEEGAMSCRIAWHLLALPSIFHVNSVGFNIFTQTQHDIREASLAALANEALPVVCIQIILKNKISSNSFLDV